VLVPPLREMEAYVFDQMVRLLWRTLVEVRPGFRVHKLTNDQSQLVALPTTRAQAGVVILTVLVVAACCRQRGIVQDCNLPEMQLYAPLLFRSVQNSQDSPCSPY
jgi:hypothetical protein